MHREDIFMKLNMSFLIKDDELLEKYKKIWDKIRNSMIKGFNTEPVYNEKKLKN